MKAIAAMSKCRTIGDKGQIPWHFPEDSKWFKETTKGGILVMGRKTYDTMKGIKLGGRKFLVVSKTMKPDYDSATVAVFDDISLILGAENALHQQLWLCGGGKLYEQLLTKCTDLYLTIINQEIEGDTKFPEFQNDFDFKEEIMVTQDFVINHYVKKV